MVEKTGDSEELFFGAEACIKGTDLVTISLMTSSPWTDFVGHDLSSEATEALRVSADFQGIKLYAQGEVTLAERCLNISGIFQIYVNCGSELSTWSCFPGHINFDVTDLLSGETYQSADFSSMNISWAIETIHDYAEKPCDQIVGEYFTLDIFRYISDLPLSNTVLEIRASYSGKESEPIIITVTVAETSQHYF